MAIRIREVEGKIIAVCAAKTGAKIGDVYIDDSMHSALSCKFFADFLSEGLITNNNLFPDDSPEGECVKLMLDEEKEEKKTLKLNKINILSLLYRELTMVRDEADYKLGGHESVCARIEGIKNLITSQDFEEKIKN